MKVNSVYKAYFESAKRFNVLYGGAGSGKSYAIAQKRTSKLVSQPKRKTIILRKNYVSIKDSCYELLRQVIYNENLALDFEFKVSPLEITFLPNGNKFIFRGMKDIVDREKIKSIVDPTDAWLEEASEFDREDLTQINLRLRGGDSLKQIDISFNPVDEDHWLNDRFFLNPPDPNEIFTLRTTYKDNLLFLDDAYINALESLMNEDENLYNIYVKGIWGSIDRRGRIYKKFDEELNVQPWNYDPRLPIILVCDFNVDPMKWALIQNSRGTDHIFDEIVKVDTDTEETVKELIDRYGKTQYIIHGDYSGTFRHTSSKSTDYDIIKQYLPRADFRIKPNPPVTDRINAVNWRLCNKEGLRRLLVDPKCKNVIADFKKVKYKEGTREEDKTQEKYDGKNPITSLVHISSAIGYYIEYEYSLKGKPQISHKW